MSIYAWIAAGVLALTVLAGAFWKGHVVGANGVQVEWQAEKLARQTAENSAILARVNANDRQRDQQADDNRKITKAHNDELNKVRADIARSGGLRAGPGICAGFATAANTQGPGSRNEADTRGGLVSPEMDRAIKSLILEVEEVAATGRACQSFVEANGMAP